MTIGEIMANGAVAAIGLLIITLQVKLGNRMTKLEATFDERLKGISKDHERLSSDLDQFQQDRNSGIYKLEKSFDMGKRAHQRIDQLQETLNRLDNKFDQQRELQLQLKSSIEKLENRFE